MSKEIARLIEIYPPPGMEQPFALGGQSAIADAIARADGDQHRSA